jgi:hypothetical protein
MPASAGQGQEFFNAGCVQLEVPVSVPVFEDLVEGSSLRFKHWHSSNPQLAKYTLVGLELPPSQRSPRQGREAELSPLRVQGAQKRPSGCSGGVGVSGDGSVYAGSY